MIELLAMFLAGFAQAATFLLKDGLLPRRFESDMVQRKHTQMGTGKTSLAREAFLRCMKAKRHRETTPG